MRHAALLLTLLVALAAPATALGAPASLVDIEDEVMCVTCKIPLNTAESPQATRQRAFIRTLVDEGRTKEQVKAALVTEYGPNVLAMPDEEGFGITAYVVPLALVAVLGAGLALLLPRWRRRLPAAIADAGAPALSTVEAQRLDDDLARYDA
jgi:cytochrome c-type biogenesis protein CcmH